MTERTKRAKMSHDDNSNNTIVKLPKDVWSMIANKASIDKVYVVTISSGGNYESEIGVFSNREQAYKIACNILGNYHLGLLISGGHTTGFKRLYDYMYHQVSPPNSVLSLKKDEVYEYPSSYEQLLTAIPLFATNAGIQPKTFISIDEKNLE